MKRNHWLIGAAILAGCCGTISTLGRLAEAADAVQNEPSLTAGSVAPVLSGEKWLKGAPVKSFERGRVYVVEFWATWCKPCIASVPHLTELQQKYPNITVIGVAASEQSSRPNMDDRLSKVESFVAKQGTGMNYSVVYDGSGSTWANWMVPAQRGGIPAAFIIGPDGRVAWVGHPMLDEFDQALDGVLSRPDVRKDASNWQRVEPKPVQNVVSAPVKAAAPDPARAAAAAPASTKLPRPAPQTKTTKSSTSGGKIAAGPKTDTTETK